MPDASWRRDLDAALSARGVAPGRRLDIAAEVAQHLADAGRSALEPGEAERLARALAGVERRIALDPPVLGQQRQGRMATLWQDLRYAARAARLAPAYSAIVIVTLALGIGANAAIFSVIDAVMLRPYYPDMDRLTVLSEGTRKGDQMSIAWPTFQDWQARQQVFEQIGIYRSAPVNFTGGGEAERLNAAVASSGLFGAIGIPPLLGRAFAAGDDTPGAARVALLSERLWRRRFGADPAIVGRTIVLSNDAHVVIGVMPAAMRYPSRLTDVWLPLGPVVPTFPASRGSHPGLFGIAKLRAGVPLARAVSDMDAIARGIEREHPTTNTEVTVRVESYYEQVVSGIRPTLMLLVAAVGFVLLIGCANLANLMLARTERRQREVAVRAALGADRRRIVQQLLTESVLLAVVGGGMGVLLATWLVRAFVASSPVSVPRIDLVAVDGRVLAFAAALSVATGLVFGLVPAMRAGATDLLSTIKQSARGGGSASRRFRSVLVVAQIALALVLLVGAGLMIRSFARLMAVETGFDPGGVVTARLSLPVSTYRDLAAWTAFHDDLVRRVSAVPGVAAAGVNSAIPLEGGGAEAGVVVEGRPIVPGKSDGVTLFQSSSPDYLRAMGIRLTRGRFFAPQDTQTSVRVVIIDDRLARMLFADADPIGKRISFEFHGDDHGAAPAAMNWREIVGVVAHVRHYGIASEPPFGQLYVPFDQPPTYYQQRRPAMALVARTSLAPEALVAALRREIAALDPDVPVYGVQTMAGYLAQSTEQPRLSVVLLGGLGALALVLAIVGIYGVVSYAVTQRTPEIGVRMALGATTGDVLRLVIGQAGTLIGAGIAIGIGASLALGSVMEGLLFQVSPRDPWTMTAIAAVLAAVAVVASIVPARRATRVDPLVALRAE